MAKKTPKLTDEDRIDAIQVANHLGFHGTGGCCGAAALAINNVLFDGKGKIIVATNNAILERDGNLFGHVGILDKNGIIWDSEREYYYHRQEGIDDFKEWAMLDPEDPDYDVTEEEANDVSIITLSKEDAEDQFQKCPHADLEKILRKAVELIYEESP